MYKTDEIIASNFSKAEEGPQKTDRKIMINYRGRPEGMPAIKK